MHTDLIRSQQRRILADLLGGATVTLPDGIQFCWRAEGESLPALCPAAPQRADTNGVYVLAGPARLLSGTPAKPWQYICYLDDTVESMGLYFRFDAQWEQFVHGYGIVEPAERRHQDHLVTA